MREPEARGRPLLRAPPPVPDVGPLREAPVPTAAAEAQDEWMPPSAWCGTGRAGGGVGWPPREWTQGADGRWHRTHVERTRQGWILVTEWGEDRDGRFVTWKERTPLGDDWRRILDHGR